MAFDSARGKSVLFGGSTVVFTFVAANDTWEWDGTMWDQKFPLGSIPIARAEHAMTYDSSRHQTILFAGLDESYNRLSDAWEWDGNRWNQNPNSGPPARHEHAMVYDDSCARIIVFGGSNSFNGGPPQYADTWDYTLDADNDGVADACDGCPNDPNKTAPGVCGCGVADTIGFVGFLPLIGGADATGGSFADPLRAFKLGSTIPVKFAASCGGSAVLTGIHTLQAIKYSSAVDSDPAIDATPTDAATTGNQFRLTDGEWHFNLSTRSGFSTGTWKLIATLSDGSTHYVWITIKK